MSTKHLIFFTLFITPIFLPMNERPHYYPIAIHHAAEAGDIALAAELLNYDPTLLHFYSGMAMTPLHTASSSNQLEMAFFLLQKGARINEQSWYGLTPFDCAAGDGNVEMLRLLLRHGAWLNGPRNNAYTLRAAAHNNHYDALYSLLDQGAYCPRAWRRYPIVAQALTAVAKKNERIAQHPELISYLLTRELNPHKAKRLQQQLEKESE